MYSVLCQDYSRHNLYDEGSNLNKIEAIELAIDFVKKGIYNIAFVTYCEDNHETLVITFRDSDFKG